MKTNMAMPLLLSLVLAALVSRPIFAELIEVEDDSLSPGPSPELYIEVPDVEPEDVNPPATAYDTELLSNYSPERLKFLQDCSKKTSSRCGEEVFKNMLEDTPVSRDCCRDLLKIGQDCHIGLVQFIFKTYAYKDIASKGVLRSKQTWNMCVNLVGSEIGAPVPLEN